MTTGQFPKRRETEEQAKRRIEKLNLEPEWAKRLRIFKPRVSASGRLTR